MRTIDEIRRECIRIGSDLTVTSERRAAVVKIQVEADKPSYDVAVLDKALDTLPS